MAWDEKLHQKIMKENKQCFDDFEYYDRTGIVLWKKKRIDLYLRNRTILKLKELSKKTGKPVSHIIEDAVKGL